MQAHKIKLRWKKDGWGGLSAKHKNILIVLELANGFYTPCIHGENFTVLYYDKVCPDCMTRREASAWCYEMLRRMT